jgi:Holliday junction resolvasome RuvABC DNA-binding subunit
VFPDFVSQDNIYLFGFQNKIQENIFVTLNFIGTATGITVLSFLAEKS